MTCKHKWRVHHGLMVDSCIGAICIKCGLRGCGCDVPKPNGKMPESFWNAEEAKEYLKREKESNV